MIREGSSDLGRIKKDCLELAHVLKTIASENERFSIKTICQSLDILKHDIKRDFSNPADGECIAELMHWILSSEIPRQDENSLRIYARSGILDELTRFLSLKSCCHSWQNCFELDSERLLLLEKGLGPEPLLCIISQIISLCRKKTGRTQFLLFSRLDQLSPLTIYYAVINGVIFPDKRVLERFRAFCHRLERSRALSLSLDNPVYVLTLLSIFGFIDDIPSFLPNIKDFPMLDLASNPECFFFSEFRPEWWPFLHVNRIMKSLKNDNRKAGIVSLKLRKYLTGCTEPDLSRIKIILKSLESAHEIDY